MNLNAGVPRKILSKRTAQIPDSCLNARNEVKMDAISQKLKGEGIEIITIYIIFTIDIPSSIFDSFLLSENLTKPNNSFSKSHILPS